MSHKRVLFRDEARRKVLRGAQLLCDAVRITLAALEVGPHRAEVGRPVVCNDGVTIAKAFELEDADENLGAAMMREASGTHR